MGEMAVNTPEQVVIWLDAIRAVIEDDETAHASEDELHRAVLRAIADGQASKPARMAALALKTQDMTFTRWYA